MAALSAEAGKVRGYDLHMLRLLMHDELGTEEAFEAVATAKIMLTRSRARR